MKSILLGINLSLFGIVNIITSNGSGQNLGLLIATIGLIISFVGFFRKEKV